MTFLVNNRFGETYSPLYFLSALGAGGLSANFFAWLMFWVPHPQRPVPLFEDIARVFTAGAWTLRIGVAVAVIGIVVFGALHFMLLLWNIREFRTFNTSPTGLELRSGNAETQLLALPLTLAMTINVCFIIAMVFVPGLWSIVEWLFPVAIAAFLVIGIWALRLLGDFFGRILTKGGFDCARNNSFAQLLPSFALSMVAVGLAAPAAFSGTPWIVGLSYLSAKFFVIASLMIGAVKLVLGMRAMMEGGASTESAPTLWIGVPILTVLAIALMRQGHGAHIHLGDHAAAIENLGLLSTFLSAQIAFLLLGWVVLRRHGYFQRYVTRGFENSPGSWALICPGVATGVILHFFVNHGLVGVGLIDKFGAVYWMISGLSIAVQMVTIRFVFRLMKRHFYSTRTVSAVMRDGSPMGAADFQAQYR
jgi:hypothetical protein